MSGKRARGRHGSSASRGAITDSRARQASAPGPGSRPVIEPEGASEEAGSGRSAANGRVRSALAAIGSGVMVALLVVIGGVAALSIVVPAMTGSRALTILTSSMEPTLPPGTLIVTRPTDPAEIEVGDVLTYQLRSGEDTLVTHRVTQRLALANGEPRFVTQGDNSPMADADPVRPVQAVGTLWYSIPYLGWVAQALSGQTRSWLIPALVAGLFGYAAWMLVAGLREGRRGNSKAGSAARQR